MLLLSTLCSVSSVSKISATSIATIANIVVFERKVYFVKYCKNVKNLPSHKQGLKFTIFIHIIIAHKHHVSTFLSSQYAGLLA